jgi:hypothetical protein
LISYWKLLEDQPRTTARLSKQTKLPMAIKHNLRLSTWFLKMMNLRTLFLLSPLNILRSPATLLISCRLLRLVLHQQPRTIKVGISPTRPQASRTPMAQKVHRIPISL